MGLILSAAQVRKADQATIINEPISSINLMERAARVCFEKINVLYPNESTYHIFCGIGNNGGDGLVIARILHKIGKDVFVYIVDFAPNRSDDFQTNLSLIEQTTIPVKTIDSKTILDFNLSGIVIDAILGTGVSRRLSGILAAVSQFINNASVEVVSIDFPSGLFDSGNTDENREVAVKAHTTLTFQVPKIAFFFRENASIVGSWVVLDIGLDNEFIQNQETSFYVTELSDAQKLLHSRSSFSHKGTFGHALIAAGSYGKMGAAILSANACLRSGAGLLTCLTPRCGYEIMQTSVPEAMSMSGDNENFLSGHFDFEKFSAVGIGPGIDTQPMTLEFLRNLLSSIDKPLVIDADALNLIAKNPGLWSLVPKNSILTPHPKEFERLFGSSQSNFDQLKIAQNQANEKGVIIIVKGKYTAIILPNEDVHFNTSGNSGMATGGSGDVLTGILTSLLAQGYLPEESARLGVYLHGMAGDLSSQLNSEESMIASDIIKNLGESFKKLHQE